MVRLDFYLPSTKKEKKTRERNKIDDDQCKYWSSEAKANNWLLKKVIKYLNMVRVRSYESKKKYNNENESGIIK